MKKPKLSFSEATRLQKALRAQFEASVRDGASLTETMQTMLERINALDIAVRLMRLHLEAVTPNGIGRDTRAWAMAQRRVQVLDELLAEMEGVQATVLSPNEAVN